MEHPEQSNTKADMPAARRNPRKTMRDREWRESNDTSRLAAVGLLWIITPPFAILLAYYTLGWKAGIVLLPIALIALRLRAFLRGKAKRKQATESWLERVWFWIVCAGLIGIPFYAIATNQQEVARFWAIPVALFSAGSSYVAFKDVKGVKRHDGMEGSVAFDLIIAFSGATLLLAVSELAWLTLGMQGWIWFHAVGLWSVMGIGAVVMVLKYTIAPSETEPKLVPEKMRLPRKWKGDETDTFDLTITRHDSSQLAYFKCRLSHVKQIVEQYDMAREYALWQAERPAPDADSPIRFEIDFGGMHEMVWRPVTRDHRKLTISYIDPHRKWWQLGYKHTTLETITPDDLLDALDLAWADRWSEIAGLERRDEAA